MNVLSGILKKIVAQPKQNNIQIIQSEEVQVANHGLSHVKIQIQNNTFEAYFASFPDDMPAYDLLSWLNQNDVERIILPAHRADNACRLLNINSREAERSEEKIKGDRGIKLTIEASDDDQRINVYVQESESVTDGVGAYRRGYGKSIAFICDVDRLNGGRLLRLFKGGLSEDFPVLFIMDDKTTGFSMWVAWVLHRQKMGGEIHSVLPGQARIPGVSLEQVTFNDMLSAVDQVVQENKQQTTTVTAANDKPAWAGDDRLRNTLLGIRKATTGRPDSSYQESGSEDDWDTSPAVSAAQSRLEAPPTIKEEPTEVEETGDLLANNDLNSATAIPTAIPATPANPPVTPKPQSPTDTKPADIGVGFSTPSAATPAKTPPPVATTATSAAPLAISEQRPSSETLSVTKRTPPPPPKRVESLPQISSITPPLPKTVKPVTEPVAPAKTESAKTEKVEIKKVSPPPPVAPKPKSPPAAKPVDTGMSVSVPKPVTEPVATEPNPESITPRMRSRSPQYSQPRSAADGYDDHSVSDVNGSLALHRRVTEWVASVSPSEAGSSSSRSTSLRTKDGFDTPRHSEHSRQPQYSQPRSAAKSDDHSFSGGSTSSAPRRRGTQNDETSFYQQRESSQSSRRWGNEAESSSNGFGTPRHSEHSRQPQYSQPRFAAESDDRSFSGVSTSSAPRRRVDPVDQYYQKYNSQLNVVEQVLGDFDIFVDIDLFYQSLRDVMDQLPGKNLTKKIEGLIERGSALLPTQRTQPTRLALGFARVIASEYTADFGTIARRLPRFIVTLSVIKEVLGQGLFSDLRMKIEAQHLAPNVYQRAIDLLNAGVSVQDSAFVLLDALWHVDASPETVSIRGPLENAVQQAIWQKRSEEGSARR